MSPAGRRPITGRGCSAGATHFLLGGSGHNAGVINPPAASKHGYWTNAELPETPDVWFAGAEKQEGSWWPAWQAWLERGGAKRCRRAFPAPASSR